MTAAGLATIPPQPQLRWLDLSQLPVDNAAVLRLAPDPSGLTQLSLETTRIDSALADWIGKATRLQELDLSGTQVNDSVVDQLTGAAAIQTVWLTGTTMTDQSLSVLKNLNELNALDLQRTQVTAEGLADFRAARPNVRLNPLK